MTCVTRPSEAELLEKAPRYSFRARMDKKTNEGPIFASAKDSTVTDVNGKEYIDFNSGQMCAALGHNHPTAVAAIKEACDTMLHAHSSHILPPRRRGAAAAPRRLVGGESLP
jgi:2,2-dialkylglycine decarboxylase (pyruvate)